LDAARSPHFQVAEKEQSMRTTRILRTLMVAGTAAALSILSIVSTVMAATGGGDFPRFK
jgi:hypothetical protein